MALICSKCSRIHMAQFTSLVNKSLCCNARVITKPNKFEMRRLLRAKKDLENYEKKLSQHNENFEPLPGNRSGGYKNS